MNYQVDDLGYYGPYGGAYVPEMLMANVEELRRCYRTVSDHPAFQLAFRDLLRDFAGRPTPLYESH